MRRIWRIGDLDGGREQFAVGRFVRSDDDAIDFHIGKDDPATDWPRYHPGPLAAYGGWRDKHLRVHFDLDDPPPAGAILHLAMLASQGPCPAVDVTVNGRRTRHFPTPLRHSRAGIPNSSAIAGPVDVRLPIPPEWLTGGVNTIVVSTVGEGPNGAPLTDPDELGRAHPDLTYFFGSAFEWLTATLAAADEQRPAATLPVSGRITPLPLYIRDGDAPMELVDVVVVAPSGFTAGQITLRIDDYVTSAPLDPAGRVSGEFRVQLAVPDRDGAAGRATADLTLDGVTTTITTEFMPIRKWTVHLLPHVHLDLGYTDVQAKVAEIHSRNVDRTLDLIDASPDYAYSVDGSFVVDQYLQTRGPAAVDRLVRAMHEGQISVNALYALFLTGVASLEECYRAGYQLAAVRRAYGIPVDYANLTDVPSYSGAVPSIVAAMGLDAFLGIQNHGRAATDDSDELHLISPFVWEGPDGADVLTYFADGYAQLRYFCGYPVTISGVADGLTRLLRRYDRPDYAPTDLPLVGIYADNEDLADGEAALCERWNSRYAYPRLRYSTVADYFAAVRPLRDRLPRRRGDGGSYWEDGLGAGARLVSDYRRAQIDLPTAEAVTALVATVDPNLAPATDELDRAWDGLLVGCEHTWTSMHAVDHPHAHSTLDQLAWKDHQVATAARVAADETRRALSQLGERITTDGPTVIVWNPLSWQRSGTVELELATGAQLIGDDGVTVPIEVIEPGPRMQRVRFTVPDVPALGYRTLRIAEPPPDARPTTDEDARGEDTTGTFETPRYRVTTDQATGRITGLFSTALGRELLDPSFGFALGDVLYVSGGGTESGRGLGSERTTLSDADLTLPLPDLDTTVCRSVVEAIRKTPDGHLITTTGSGPSLPEIRTEIRLFDHDDRIEITVDLTKDEVFAKEGVYVAFPFAIDQPAVRYDRQQGWVDPATDHVPGACNEWFTTQYGINVADDDLAITWTSLDAPLWTIGDVVRGRWPRAFQATNGLVLSWVMNNYWWTNFPPAQSGPLTLRYAFRPDRSFHPAAAARFGRSRRTPLVGHTVTWFDKMDSAPRLLPAACGSLLDVAAPDHVALSVAGARVGPGLLVRVQELAGQPGEARIRHPDGPAGRATACTALEDPIGPLPVADDGTVVVTVTPNQVVSVLLETGAAAGGGLQERRPGRASWTSGPRPGP